MSMWGVRRRRSTLRGVHGRIMWEGRVSPRVDVVRHDVLTVGMGWRAIWTFVGRGKVLSRRVIDGIISFGCVLGHGMNSSRSRCC